MDPFGTLFDSRGFMPHGHCYLWTPDVLWLHVVSDAMIALAYYSIPAALLVFLRKRRDVVFPWAFWLFIAFILACGTTHLAEIWTTWVPDYRAEGVIKALTAAVSIVTAFAMWPLLPKAIALPSPAQLAQANAALGREVEQRRAAEARLREASLDQAQRLSAIVDSSDDAILSKTLDGTILTWNAAAERLYGYSAHEAVGRNAAMLLDESETAEYAQRVQQVRGGEPSRNFETQRRRKDGSIIHVSLTLSPIHDQGGNVVAISAIARDITEREQNRKRLERANEELRRRREEIEALLYMVSHDLRSPLVTISGFTAVAEEELAAGAHDEVADALARVRKASVRANRLIDDLLQLSRAGRSLVPERLDPAVVVREVIEQLEPQLAAGGAQVEVAEPLPEVLFDRSSLQRVFDNLLGNAIKYGVVNGAAAILVRGAAEQGRVVLEVVDRGPGIPEPGRSEAFEPYARLSSSKDGSGLGLAIVAKLVQAHGGRVLAVETPGGGATLRIELPPPG